MLHYLVFNITNELHLNGVIATLSLTAPSSKVANSGTTRHKVTSAWILVQNGNLSQTLSTCLSGYSHVCWRGQWHPQLVRSSDMYIKETVTGTLISPREKEPQVQSTSHHVINLYSWSSAYWLYSIHNSKVEDSTFETDLTNTASLRYIP